MKISEKKLYHQIHPLKLTVDWVAGCISLYFFWNHTILLALLIAFIPPIITSLLIIKFDNLEKYKESSIGRYVKKYMRKEMEILRMFGFFVMAVSAWFHTPSIIAVGLGVILFAWFYGKLQ